MTTRMEQSVPVPPQPTGNYRTVNQDAFDDDIIIEHPRPAPRRKFGGNVIKDKPSPFIAKIKSLSAAAVSSVVSASKSAYEFAAKFFDRNNVSYENSGDESGDETNAPDNQRRKRLVIIGAVCAVLLITVCMAVFSGGGKSERAGKSEVTYNTNVSSSASSAFEVVCVPPLPLPFAN